ncbi:flavodoxin domain-containing protein [Williamsia sterculiae]|uniref:MioC protein n=1 Tax=Williamsia sterculiae TaxID=1344003 RepID=A0A1N7GP33_9NOCA|nr:flavodoxin family protein [Williamsia sterculiae]SIS14333.1 MioC protein [Williamsia sterculiae]
MSLLVLYGTETGTAELVADAIADVLSRDHAPSVYDMSDFDIGDLEDVGFLVTVCSTYGEGEVPSGAEPFIEALTDERPDLTHLTFAVFGLGDIIYEDTFNRGGELIAETLGDLGATQVGEHARHDNSSAIRPARQGAEWAATISPLITRHSVTAGRSVPVVTPLR